MGEDEEESKGGYKFHVINTVESNKYTLNSALYLLKNCQLFYCEC